MEEEEDLAEIEKQRDELLKRIQEKERLMNLIQSKHVKGGLNEIKPFQDKINRQKEEEQKKVEQARNISIEKGGSEGIKGPEDAQNVKEFGSINFNSIVQGVKMEAMILKLQRFWRKYKFKKSKEEKRDFYLNKLRKEFYSPITYERIAEIRKDIIKALKSLKQIDPQAYKIVSDTYFNNYRIFCFEFPEKEYIRENNFLFYFQCLDLLQYLENLKQEKSLDEYRIFDKFMLDENKGFKIKLRLDEMEKAFQFKNDIYEYNMIDDFEENALLDEIDMRYKFEKRSSILNKKP